MKNPGFLFFVFFICACASFSAKDPVSDTYYVMAGGSDRNNGLSIETPFRSLFKALVMASEGPVKIITILGKLDVASEQSTDASRVFIIQGTGKDRILIRGMALNDEPAALSAEGSGRRAVLVKGRVNIRLEDIEISGGAASDEGGGLGIGSGSLVTLGPGAVIRNNRSGGLGGGVVVAPGGSLFIEGGRILDNFSAAMGGGVAVVGESSVLTIRDGEISNNHAQGGGGVAIRQGGVFTLSGGTIHDNTADLAGGGVVLNQAGILTMEGGLIRGNRSSGSGGGVALIDQGKILLKAGEIHGNRAAEHGGGVASDNTSAIDIQGGYISANRAASQGGAVFTAGSFVKSAGVIYGNEAPEDQANIAAFGAAVFIYRGEGTYKIREQSAGESLILDASANDGWILEVPREPDGEE
ncbi:MAG: right-handed parallel beta-helix repeat-containing protein [Spirochaetaceae bacterium]|jgi:hypothetical protein|nr:right-handed parallel beta-helix repeat-containing protein [Spirochaetaceae bacterium]